MYDEYAVVLTVTGVERPEFTPKPQLEPVPDTEQRVEIDFSDMVVSTGD